MDRMSFLDQLRFIQRVLEGNPPQADKDRAAQMVRDMRRQAMDGKSRTERVLEFMRDNPARELYEGVDNRYWLAYGAGLDYEPLDPSEAQALAAQGAVRQKYPGCYVIHQP